VTFLNRRGGGGSYVDLLKRGMSQALSFFIHRGPRSDGVWGVFEKKRSA